MSLGSLHIIKEEEFMRKVPGVPCTLTAASKALFEALMQSPCIPTVHLLGAESSGGSSLLSFLQKHPGLGRTHHGKATFWESVASSKGGDVQTWSAQLQQYTSQFQACRVNVDANTDRLRSWSLPCIISILIF